MVPGSSLELQGPEAGWSSSPLPGEERGHQERHLRSQDCRLRALSTPWLLRRATELGLSPWDHPQERAAFGCQQCREHQQL